MPETVDFTVDCDEIEASVSRGTGFVMTLRVEKADREELLEAIEITPEEAREAIGLGDALDAYKEAGALDVSELLSHITEDEAREHFGIEKDAS